MAGRKLEPGHPSWPKVEEAAALRAEGLSQTRIADEMGEARASVQNWLQAYDGREDPAISAAKQSIGTNMTPALAWVKTKNKDGADYSVLLKPDPLPDDTLNRIKAAFEGMEPAKPIDAPAAVMEDLCTLYPLMDVHFGMRAWARETGGPAYDVDLATQDMRHAFAKVANLTPDSRNAILLIGGDFFHADDNRAETPQSKHKLDVDGRFYRVIDKGIALVAETIERLLQKHQSVTCRVLRGNHDEHSHLVLTFALAQRYREDPRIEIEQNPMDLFMAQWGKCLISAHHGDKAPPERLTLYLSDVCPYWSETRHRFCFTGHVHHDKSKDTGPLKWESLRAFCPPDSYAAGMGFASRRAQQALTFSKSDGLVLRAMDPIDR